MPSSRSPALLCLFVSLVVPCAVPQDTGVPGDGVPFAMASIAAQDSAVATSAYATVENVAYRDSDDPLMEKMCRLDIYHPVKQSEAFATVVWFHGGGLTGGKREIPQELRDQGIAVVGVGYRLSPSVTVKDCLEDAAAAVAWVFEHIESYGGSDQRIFVSGHSAGGYLTSMLGLDKRWLQRHSIDANQIAGLIPFSGQTITHFTARKELGIKDTQPLVDELAPLFHVRSDAPPLLLITGDRELEMLGRYEENAYLWRMMKVAGHTETTLYELDGFNHGQMDTPAYPLLLQFVRERTQPSVPNKPD